MKQQTFALQPFSPTASDLKITGNITRNHQQLAIKYNLVGNLQDIIISPPSATPTRQHELWQDTCFEFFLGIKNTQKYWEFNLSPGGHWNIYRFDSYRQGMQEETAWTTLPFSVVQQVDNLILEISIDLSEIIAVEQTLDVAITTVIKHQENQVSYWALVHKGVEADFHLRESFLIEL
ncbi:DOMON-like domain-containing protein [Nostoc sp. TCL26-01]|uniref:DOMON-like domain-containing protein n=1 Tax=Nostoc sp. TCL26-01 TaxID=2576904 RepID=UPI0015C15785|nr:DOMON-like domain-containing protein [Nostoc sp. TCL26-01]QLE55745.1 DOMON-like domain-containing protein [Nostoc sp. TCL26-01]